MDATRQRNIYIIYISLDDLHKVGPPPSSNGIASAGNPITVFNITMIVIIAV